MANGVRSATQNIGYAVSTAMSLALITSWLAPEQKRAAFAGTLARLSGDALTPFDWGYRAALLVMAGFCMVGLVASLLRNPPPPSRIPPAPTRGQAPAPDPVPTRPRPLRSECWITSEAASTASRVVS
jgi:hypothetical protein